MVYGICFESLYDLLSYVCSFVCALLYRPIPRFTPCRGGTLFLGLSFFPLVCFLLAVTI